MLEWISVKDKLPPNSDKVLAITHGLTDICRYEIERWFSLCFNQIITNGAVTHWMPLPDLPKE